LQILQLNDKSAEVFAKSGGYDLIGKDLMGCHNQRSREIIELMLTEDKTNAYTIEKNGVRKLIYQSPWYENGEVAGLVEISIQIPAEMPHFIR
jgi:hypothetical protein